MMKTGEIDMSLIESNEMKKMEVLLASLENKDRFLKIDCGCDSYFKITESTDADFMEIAFETITDLEEKIELCGYTIDEKELIHQLSLLSFKIYFRKEEAKITRKAENSPEIPDYIYVF